MGYCIEHLPSRISIGRETETGVTDIRIDCTDWLERWPGMAISAMYRPPEGEPYIVLAEMIGNSLVWHVSDADTAAAGTGRLELTGVAEGKRKLSALVDVQVARRLEGTAGPMPEAAKPWADEVMAAAERITGMRVVAETLEPGSDATAAWDGAAGLMTLGIPRGRDGGGVEATDDEVMAMLAEAGALPALAVDGALLTVSGAILMV